MFSSIFAGFVFYFLVITCNAVTVHFQKNFRRKLFLRSWNFSSSGNIIQASLLEATVCFNLFNPCLHGMWRLVYHSPLV